MGIRRRCYDKAHRCPGWAGGGFRYARTVVCDGGSVAGTYELRSYWLPTRHDCGTIVLPINFRWIDPTFLAWRIRSNIRRWNEDRPYRKASR